MKKIFVIILVLYTTNQVFSQKNISIQLALARGSSYSFFENKEQIINMKMVPQSRFSYEGNIGYQITPKNRISLGVVLNNYSWEVRMKSPNNTFKGKEYYYLNDKYRLLRYDGYNVIFNLKYRTNIITTNKSALGVSLGLGAYKTSSIIDDYGKFMPMNTNNYMNNSNRTPIGAYWSSEKSKPFMLVTSGNTFQYYYYWNFVPSLGLEYCIKQKSNEIGLFLNASIAAKKNYEFDVDYYENKDGNGLYGTQPTETGKVINNGMMLRAGIYYTLNHVVEKTKANPIKTKVIPALIKFAKTEQHNILRKSKITIWYGKANHLSSALQYQSSNDVSIETKPLNQNQFAFGMEYSRRLANRNWNLGTGLRLVTGNFKADFYTKSGEFLINYNEIYFSNIQVPIFLNRNFYIFNQKILFQTDLGIVANIHTNGIGVGGYTSSNWFDKDAASLNLSNNEVRRNKDVYIKCAVSFPKYAKGLQVFVLYSGIVNLNGKQHTNIVNGSIIRYTGEPPAPRVREERYITMYYKPTYISFGLAYDFNTSKRQKKAIEFQ